MCDQDTTKIEDPISIQSPRGGGSLKSLVLVGISSAATLAAIEGAARLAARPGSEPAVRYTEHDPVLGWRHRPGARATLPRGDYVVNSLGLRDRERGYATPAGVFRLLALGDSFTEGFSVAFEDSVTQVLERTLGGTRCPVEVINGGTVGYSTDQEYLFFTREGSRYSPRVVLLLFYYNDVVYNGRADYAHTPKPLLAFRDGQPFVKNLPVPEAEARPGATEAPPPPARGSAALAWLGRRLLAGAPRAYHALAVTGVWPRIRAVETGAELKIYERAPPREVLTAWQHTARILQSLAEAAASGGARLLVVYVPSKMEVNDRDWELTRLKYGVSDATWDRSAVARRLGEAGRAAGFPVLDLTPALRREDRGLLGGTYHPEGGHWNALGHRVAAREVARGLRERGWAPCGD